MLYYLPTLGSTDPYVLLPTTTLIQLGRSAYAPARMEIVDDVINMSRLRGRADSSQLAPVQIMTVMDPDGAGTPITAWAGRGSSGGYTGGTMDTSAMGGGETAAIDIALQAVSPPRRRMPVNTLRTEGWDPTQRHSPRRWHGEGVAVRCTETTTPLRPWHPLSPRQYQIWGHSRHSWRRHYRRSKR